MPVGRERQKSFHGKAHVQNLDNGDTLLISYDTPVCAVDSEGNVKKLWDGYSATTMRHINAFLTLMDVPGGGKAWWDSLPVEEIER